MGTETPKFIQGEDVKLYVKTIENDDGKKGESWNLIGLCQSFSSQDGRALPQVGELGSDSTVTLLTPSQKSASLTGLMVSSRSLLSVLYGLIAPQSGGYSQNDIIGGDTIKIYSKKRVGGTKDTDDSVFAPDNFIGLIQQYSVSSSAPISQLGEVGSDRKFLVVNKADKSISFSRLISKLGNALYAFYHDAVASDDGAHNGKKIRMDLDDPLFKSPIDIGIEVLNEGANDNNSNGNIKILLHGALPQSISGGAQQGSRGIIDSIAFKWDKTRYLSNDDTHHMLIDLDNPDCRKPFDLKVVYSNIDDGNKAEEHILKNCLVSSVSQAVNFGSKTTAESMQLMWETTE